MGLGGLKGHVSQKEVGLLEYLVQNHLWIFAIWIVPLSVAYDIVWYIRTRWGMGICVFHALLLLFIDKIKPLFRLTFALTSKKEVRHEDKVKDVQKQVRSYSTSTTLLLLFCWFLS